MAAEKPRKLKDLTADQRCELVARVQRLKGAGRMGQVRTSAPVKIQQFRDPLPIRQKKAAT